MLTILACCLLVFFLDRFLLWIEKKGWLYYRKRKSPGGFSGNALLEVNSIFQPSSHNVIYVKQKSEFVKCYENENTSE